MFKKTDTKDVIAIIIVISIEKYNIFIYLYSKHFP